MAASVVLVKTFTYRDKAEEWSNRYHFSALPADPAEWKSVADDLAALESMVYSELVNIVRAYGYENDDDPNVWTHDYADASASIPGALALAADEPMPGDMAGTIRWWHGQLNSRGRKIYTRKFFHSVHQGTDPDKVNNTQLIAYGEFAAALAENGFGTGTDVRYCDKDGNLVVTGAHRADPFITTRTLKRRGKRPPTSP